MPLNVEAVQVLRQQIGKHLSRDFTYKGKPVTKANNHAWHKALARAGIDNFRWHDLRHTWASCMSNKEHHYMFCRNWEAGPAMKWFADMPICPLGILRSMQTTFTNPG